MIKNISQMNQMLGNADAVGWTKKVGSELTSPLEGLEGPSSLEGGSKTFGDFLKDSISQVNGLQNDANLAMEKLASGESRDLHETLLAVERAEIAFKAMNQVRSKVIDAYKEIMRMQI
jgi:flagellar hook-basal body complex protein FliE